MTKPKYTPEERAARLEATRLRRLAKHGTKMDKVRNSWMRLEAGLATVGTGSNFPRLSEPKPTPMCSRCSAEPVWASKLCTGCIILEGRAATKARRRAATQARYKKYFLERRAARLGGDWELWHELKMRWDRGKLDNESRGIMDRGPDAAWRVKYKLEAAHVLQVAAALKAAERLLTADSSCDEVKAAK